MQRPRWLKAVAALGLVAVFSAACGGDGEDNAAESDVRGRTEEAAPARGEGVAPSTDTGAAELRAGLTSLLQEHVYLAGIAISTGVSSGLDSPEFEAAAATLDQNSVGLSEAIGSVYGDDAAATFLDLWRKHIGFFVDYTKAGAAGDEAGQEKARDELDKYRQDFGAFLAGANPNLTQEAVADNLVPHVDSVFATIDSVLAQDGETFDKLREAAGHMPMTANVLAGAIVAQFPDTFA